MVITHVTVPMSMRCIAGNVGVFSVKSVSTTMKLDDDADRCIVSSLSSSDSTLLLVVQP